jgi:hypothetical protein
MLSEQQKAYRDEINRCVRGAGGWMTSWPHSRYVTFEILSQDIGNQLMEQLTKAGLPTVYLSTVMRTVPDGVSECFAFQTTLPKDKPPVAPSIPNEIVDAERKRWRKAHGLRY